MAKKGQQLSRKEQYGAYEKKGQYSINKKAKLARHMKKHPNDSQSAATKVAAKPPRKPSKNKVWSSTQVLLAGIYRSLGEKGNIPIIQQPQA